MKTKRQYCIIICITILLFVSGCSSRLLRPVGVPGLPAAKTPPETITVTLDFLDAAGNELGILRYSVHDGFRIVVPAPPSDAVRSGRLYWQYTAADKELDLQALYERLERVWYGD